MTRSTNLLFRQVRIRIGVGAVAAFVLFLFFGLIDPPLGPEYTPLLLFAGCGLAFLMGLHSFLGGTMFPVTDRQVAWIPMAAWAVCVLAGAAGVLAGQAWASAFSRGGVPFREIASYWLGAIRVWPPVLFILLLLWRSVRLNAFFLFLAFLPEIGLSPGRTRKVFPPWILDISLALWPLWLAGCVFLVWEAPRQTAVLRRLDYQIVGVGLWRRASVPQLNGPTRPSWATNAADGMLALAIMTAIVSFFRAALSFSVEDIRRNPFLLFFPFLVFVPISFLVVNWRENRASGLRPWAALVALLAEATGVGYAFRNRLGAKRGAVVRCPHCREWRMAWLAACPACGDGRSERPPRPVSRRPGIGATIWPAHDPGALMFRALAPLYVSLWVLATNCPRWLGY